MCSMILRMKYYLEWLKCIKFHLVWSVQMSWIFSFHMLLLLLQGMLGIVLIGACRENESSCNLTSLSGREWIRLIEHHSKWGHEISPSLFPCHSTSQHSPSYRQSINTSGSILIRLFAACVPCHGLSIKRRKKRWRKKERKQEQSWNTDDAHLRCRRPFVRSFYPMSCAMLIILTGL